MTSSSIRKPNFKTAVKFVFGAGAIAYVIRSSMVDFESLWDIAFHPASLLLSLIFLSAVVLCLSVRWYTLARAQGLRISFREIFNFVMIAQFFNNFMPGAVGGDFVKAWYAAEMEKNQRAKAIFTVVLDRLLGLSVFICASGLTVFLFQDSIRMTSQLYFMRAFAWTFTGCSILATLFFFSSGSRANFPLPEWLRVARPLVEMLRPYQKRFTAVFYATLASVALAVIYALLWALQAHRMGIDIPLVLYFFIVPLGLVASAIPLLPRGIGVGQVAFYALFQCVGAAHPEQGATLCTLMQLHLVLFGMIGSIFYLRYKKLDIREPQTSSASQAL